MAVLGPNGDVKQTLLGNYVGQPESIVSHCAGIKAVVSNTVCVQGCDINSQRTSGFTAACAAANASQVTVLGNLSILHDRILEQ